jgi:hypothetical protein
MLKKHGFNLKNTMYTIADRDEIILFLDDISERKIKGSIYHEMVHWLDNTFNDEFITRLLIRSDTNISVLNADGKIPQSSYYEVNAQVHAIKQMRRQTNDHIWNSWTWDMLVKNSVVLTMISEKTKDVNDYVRWKRALLKRLIRENLIGNNINAVI